MNVDESFICNTLYNKLIIHTQLYNTVSKEWTNANVDLNEEWLESVNMYMCKNSLNGGRA